jgi:hypothetical protein
MPVILSSTTKSSTYDLSEIPKDCIPLALKDQEVAKLLLDAFYQQWYKFGSPPFIKEKTLTQNKMEWVFVEPYGYLHLPKTIGRYFLLKDNTSASLPLPCRNLLSRHDMGTVDLSKVEVKNFFPEAHIKPFGQECSTICLYSPSSVVSLLVQTRSSRLEKILLGSTFLSFLHSQGFEVPLQGYFWRNLKSMESSND